MNDPPPYFREDRQEIVAALVIALIALWIAGPVLATGSWYQSHDGMRYPYLLYRFKEAVDHGILYPRWMPELMAAYGYPTFVFYQPGLFYFTLPFAYITDVVTASYAGIFLMFWVGGWGAYRLARLSLPPWISLVIALVFMFTPYHGTNLIVRGDYSELFAMLLCPWSVYFGLILCDRLEHRQRIGGAAIEFITATAAVTIAHPFVAFFSLPFVAGLLVVRSLSSTTRGEMLLVSLALLALAAVLTSPYWLTLFQLKDDVRHGGAISGFYDPLNRLKDASRRLFKMNNPFIYYILLAGAGFVSGWRKSAVMRYAAVAFLVLLFMLTNFSRPVWELGHVILKYIQFPWRIHATLATVQLLGFILLGQAMMRIPLRRAVPAALLMLILAVSLAYKPFRLLVPLREVAALAVPEAHTWKIFHAAKDLPRTNYYAFIQERELTQFYSAAGTGEFMPRNARAQGLPNRIAQLIPVVQFVRAGEESLESQIEKLDQSSIFRIVFVLHLDSPESVILNQFYFPGWRVVVDGRSVHWKLGDTKKRDPEGVVDATLDTNGRIKLDFHRAGHFRVEAWYDGPPGWQWRNMAIAILAPGLIVLIYRRRAILERLKRA